MLCRIGKKTIQVDNGEGFEGQFGEAVPVLATDCRRLANTLNPHLFHKHGIHVALRHAKDENYPYVLVTATDKKPTTRTVKLARAVCLAYAQALNDHYLYLLD